MRPTLIITLLASLALLACSKSAPPTAKPEAPAKKAAPAEGAPAKAGPAKAEKAEPAAPAAANIDTKTTVAKPGAEADGMDSETKAKLAKVYTEIYCAQRRGESEKLLDIYTKNGFDDPESWTKTWTKAAEDGAWVAKTTHDAIRACSQEAPAPASP